MLSSKDWVEVFSILWAKVHPLQEDKVLDFFRELLQQNNQQGNLYETYEELEAAAKKECNLVSRDDVRRIASEELGMIDGPGEER